MEISHQEKAKQDRLSSLFFILLGIGSCLEGVRLSPGNFHHPGTGFLPLVLGILLILLAALIFIGSFFDEESGAPLWAGTGWMRTVITMGILLIFPITLRWLGFLLSASLTLALLFYHSGFKGWPLILCASIGASFLCYLLFVVLLGSEFPPGLFSPF